MATERITCPKCGTSSVALSKHGKLSRHLASRAKFGKRGTMCPASGDLPSQWRTSKAPELRLAEAEWKAAVEVYKAAQAAAPVQGTYWTPTPAVTAASQECSRTYRLLGDIRERLGLCRDPQDARV